MALYKVLKRKALRIHGRMILVAPGAIVEPLAADVERFPDFFEAVPEETPPQGASGGTPPASPPSPAKPDAPPGGPVAAAPDPTKEDDPAKLPGDVETTSETATPPTTRRR